MAEPFAPFGHVVTALVTPFAGPEAQVDYTGLSRLIGHLRGRTDSIVLLGTTGEGPTVTPEERTELIRQTRQLTAAAGMKLIVNVGTNDTRASVKNAGEARELGADGVMVVMPYYNKPGPPGQYQHFRAVAEAAGELPVLIYNIPGRTGRIIDLDTLIRLVREVENIVAVKEASGSLDYASQLISELGTSHFALYAGDDSLTLPILAVGGVGVVSVASHLIGERLREMCHAYLEGQTGKAARIHQTYLPLMKALFMDTNPIPVKFALSMLGLIEDRLRPPLYSLPEEKRDGLLLALERAGILERQEAG